MRRRSIAGAILLFVSLVACNKDSDDTGWHPGEGDACLSCHVGIENVHFEAVPYGDCTRCHGGDGKALTQEEAHVAVPENWAQVRGDGLPPAPHGYIKDMPPDMLDQLSADYIRFINPGDMRAAEAACGECHEGYVERLKNSIMTTNAGHYMPTRFYVGLQDRDAIYGSHPAMDLGYTGAAGTVEQLVTLLPPTEETVQAAIDMADTDPQPLEQVAYEHYLAKNCNTCHAAGYPKNNSRATYRSTGCSSCHVIYGKDGVYEGNDEAISKTVPVYPKAHEITSAIPAEQCATCHYQGGRIGLLFRGIREGGFLDIPENAELWNESVYTHTPGYYILDEDTTNNVDETPPDLHFEAGMHCVDCHVGSDVHGDGRIYSTSKGQVDLRCEDCHGTVREAIRPDAGGVYRTASGRALTQLYQDENGNVALMGRVDGKKHVVPQPSILLELRGEGSTMHEAMGENENGWSHTDALTCDTCHTSYNQQCLGCHVTLDTRLSQTDYQTGLKTPGLTSGKRSWYSLDHLVLCQSPDGRAQSCLSSQQVQMTVIDESGKTVLGRTDEEGKDLGVFRSTSEHASIIGWAPFFQHTSSRKPRACKSCHPTDTSPEEIARIRGVYGFGTGEYLLTDAEGVDVDALQFLHPDGSSSTVFVHPGTGPLALDVINKALSVTVSE
jgi:hypothetical protein